MKLSVLAKPLKSEGFKKYARNTGWLFAEQILRILSGILVGVWTARYLGPESFGIYSYAISFVALFGVIANLGLQSITVRELLNFPDQQKSILGTAFYLQIIGALFTVLLICAVLPFTSNNDQTNIYILIIASGLFFQAFQVIDSYFQSQVLAKYISICRLVQLFISAVLKVAFVLAEADLIYFVLIILIDNLTLALTLSFAYWKKGNHTFYKSWHIS
ncbi:oligosaccharide flippase family protein, partial [Pontibacter rugosus]